MYESSSEIQPRSIPQKIVRAIGYGAIIGGAIGGIHALVNANALDVAFRASEIVTGTVLATGLLEDSKNR